MQRLRVASCRQPVALQRARGQRRAVTVRAAAQVEAVPRVSLHARGTATPVSFAPLINGCWQLAGGHGREVYDDIDAKLRAHAEAGLSSFDTADIYGPSEGILGGFAEAWAEAGNEPVQVLTKFVPNIFQSRPTAASVEAAVKRSLTALRCKQLDLVQMHWWDYAVPGMTDAALWLADLQGKGLIKQVGTTNMNVAALQQLLDAGVPVANNQVQFSLLDRRPLNGMLQFAEANNLKLMTYGSVAGGLLSNRYVEEPSKGLFGKERYGNVDLNTSSLKMYWRVTQAAGGQSTWRQLLLVLHGVAQKHGVSVACVALRWVMQQGSGSTVYPIVGLRGTSHIADNKRALSLTLDADDLAAIDEVLRQAPGPPGDCYSFERGE